MSYENYPCPQKLPPALSYFAAAMKSALSRFSWPFLLCVTCVYFSQGFKSVGSNALSFYLKDTIKMEPSAQQALLSTAHIPWSIKPIYGLLSDYFPIFGQKRKPYIVLAGALGVIGWFLLALLAYYPNQTASASMVLILATATNLSTAVSDVVVDAMVAEQSSAPSSGNTEQDKAEEDEVEGVLQSLCWQVDLRLLFCFVPFCRHTKYCH
jgi:hypothetical protein